MSVVGIDLAGSEKRDTGYCLLAGNKADVTVLHTDMEIIERIRSDRPELVGVDAPLSLPEGRRSIDQKNDRHFRGCDLELRKLGIRFFPITLGPMRMLTKRGIGLKNEIKRFGIRVIEVYPGATYDIYGIGRKDKEAIAGFFNKRGYHVGKGHSQDELDAVCCAYTTLLFLEKKAIGIGNPDEGQIIIPKVKKS